MEKNPILGPSLRPQKAPKANWRSRLHAQSSQMHSIPLGPSEKNFVLCKSTKKARYVRSLGKKPHFGAFPEAQKGVLICAICLRKAAHWPNNNANPSGLSEKNSLLCRKSAIFSIRWKKTPFWGLPSGPKKLKKLTGASRKDAQSSQMHSIPLGPSQKNSFYAKVQRKRDMCDP